MSETSLNPGSTLFRSGSRTPRFLVVIDGRGPGPRGSSRGDRFTVDLWSDHVKGELSGKAVLDGWSLSGGVRHSGGRPTFRDSSSARIRNPWSPVRRVGPPLSLPSVVEYGGRVRLTHVETGSGVGHFSADTSNPHQCGVFNRLRLSPKPIRRQFVREYSRNSGRWVPRRFWRSGRFDG